MLQSLSLQCSKGACQFLRCCLRARPGGGTRKKIQKALVCVPGDRARRRTNNSSIVDTLARLLQGVWVREPAPSAPPSRQSRAVRACRQLTSKRPPARPILFALLPFPLLVFPLLLSPSSSSLPPSILSSLCSPPALPPCPPSFLALSGGRPLLTPPRRRSVLTNRPPSPSSCCRIAENRSSVLRSLRFELPVASRPPFSSAALTSPLWSQDLLFHAAGATLKASSPSRTFPPYAVWKVSRRSGGLL